MSSSPEHIFLESPYLRRITGLAESQLSSIDQYLQTLLQQDADILNKTHFFHDRYENIYLENCNNSDLNDLMSESLGFCAELLEVNKDELDIGYWFNLMAPGHVTTLHTHDNLNELISGVVYLTVPDDSGDLVLQTGDQEISLTPVTGNYIFFNPETPHLVTKNNSPTHRLSIGMNIGLKKDRIDWKRV
ncbi:MAG: hypothetical protein HOM14_10155 [Gammaproteobacteria bacterium]|jgi:quercetin dioxygenase-like cupin family protein|nr:hypothetical protein [Gammaproteobacteria bacterium]MBT3724532.1 hypothetical protein [Gammaproteobacteria bacterium]MBT4076385.1 hypothetical protein [Gammaproteobacteria bacterium]MBT4193179.1 hypothetical protein [Gammaproteobacteria bacterium]MBT4450314.1 hypothetical protein [Gammaproteobacteria bacterium]